MASSFAAGIVAATCLYQAFHIGFEGSMALGTASLFCLAAMGCTCLSLLRKDEEGRHFFMQAPPAAGRTLIYSLFALCGACIYFMSSVPTVMDSTAASPAEAFFAARAESVKKLIDALPFEHPESNALIKAFLTGDRSGLGREVKAAFRDSGASHILALSGMHLSIIYLVLSRSLGIIGHSPAARRLTSVIIITGTGFFTLMTGAAPSLVRAYIFVFLRETSILCRRPMDNLHLFSIALIIHLALSPASLTDIGFQLSYLAMAGIFTLFPALENLWTKEEPQGYFTRGSLLGKGMRKIWSLCTLSIACQAFTAPLAWYYFRSFPAYFLLTNLLCIPLTNAINALSILIIALAGMGICPDFLLRIDELLISATLFCLNTIAAL